MKLTCYSSKQISELLGVIEEDFHRKIKKQIKAEFKVELDTIGVINPDILLDSDYRMYLADPRNHNNFFDTELSIFDYI